MPLHDVDGASPSTHHADHVANGNEVGATGAAAVTATIFDESMGRGAKLFRKCGVCHTVTADSGYKAGPTLYRLFGRRAASIANYPYSEALRSIDLIWTAETVSQLFNVGPDKFAPGTKMPLQRMSNPQDRDDLIKFLKRVTMPADQ